MKSNFKQSTEARSSRVAGCDELPGLIPPAGGSNQILHPAAFCHLLDPCMDPHPVKNPPSVPWTSSWLGIERTWRTRFCRRNSSTIADTTNFICRWFEHRKTYQTTAMNNSIVDEVRAARAALAEEHGYTRESILKWARQKQAELKSSVLDGSAGGEGGEAVRR